MTSAPSDARSVKPVRPLQSAVVFFAGDSGDGMQLAGTQFTDTSAIFGNDVATFPDFPAEIRAPQGTVPGVSGFQVNFSSHDIHTPGDEVDALIAMNPAAFKAHIDDVKTGGIVIVNEDEFDKVNLRKAAYPEGYNPLDDEKYSRKYRLYRVPITRSNEAALKETGLGAKDIDRCKNMWSLGLIFWLYDRPLDVTVNYLNSYFGEKKKLPLVADANIRALKAGFFFGETAEIFTEHFKIEPAHVAPGTYTKITGNEALAMGLVAASTLSGKTLVYGSYPITPASSILEYLAGMRHFGVKTVQAEDEIAAVCVAIGASYAGQLGVTGTSGPGLCLKSEALNLAIVAELPLVVVDVQRGGPSTGLPTKTEQADLLQAMFGRNSDSPLVIVAPQSPADCFDIAIDACRIAMQHMVPVIILTDGYLANGAEPWRIPDAKDYPKIEIKHATPPKRDPVPPAPGVSTGSSTGFMPYARDKNFVRPWAIPGQPDLMHRLGGLEKADITGGVNYDPGNHQRMTDLRHAKVAAVAAEVPLLEPHGDPTGDLLVLGWGGTFGSILSAVDKVRARGLKVSSAHLRNMNPMPANLGTVLKNFKKVLIPELNMGQLRLLIRGKFLVDARGLNKVQGKPFLVEEIEQAIELMLNGGWPADRDSLIPRDHHVSASDPMVMPAKGAAATSEG